MIFEKVTFQNAYIKYMLFWIKKKTLASKLEK